MTDDLHILILEDASHQLEALKRELLNGKFNFVARRVGSRTEFLQGLEEFAPDVILSDYCLSGFGAMQALDLTRERAPHVPFIIVAGRINEETAVECMKAGAVDYVLPEQIGRIGSAIQAALEKKQAEAKLRQSEELLRLITDNVTDLIAILDLQGNRLYNSASYREILGDPHALRGTDSFKEIHPDDVTRIRRAFEETVRTGIGQRAEYRFQLKDGNLRYIESQGSVIRDQKGNVDKVLVVSRDVTDRKHAEEELRRSEERFRALIENSSDAIALLNPSGVVLYAGPSTERVLGYRNEEFVGRRLFSLIHPEDAERSINLLHGLSQSVGHTVRLECRIRHRDDSWRWMEGAAKNLLREPGVQAMVVNYRDITERKMAEAEIQKLAAFPLYNPNPVLELSADGELTYFNDAAQQLAGLLGKNHPREMLPSSVRLIIKACLSTGKSTAGLEMTIEGRTLSWSFFPILVTQVVQCYAFDITERLTLESQLRQSQKMESVGQLAAGVAHDFNNILTIIQGHAELLLAAENAPHDRMEALKHISAAASRAANLTRQLLTFSRRQIMQPKVLDLNEVVGNVTRTLSHRLGEHITLQCNYAADLPTVLADLGMMEQLVNILTVNARDAMPGGGQLIVSTFATEIDSAYVREHPEARAGHFVCLGVSDTGTGMDQATLVRIFEPFFTTKEVGKGTGLGLATAYGIAKLHNGWIEVESRVDMGSTFTIFLPAARAGAEMAAFYEEKSPPRCGDESILIVDDETALRGLMRGVLQHHGYHVFEAATAAEALALWEKNSAAIDMLVTDLVLPDGQGGGELARAMQNQKPLLRVVFTCGFNLESESEAAGFHEGLNFLRKPFQPLALARTVRRCLDSPVPQ
jgi:two-component system, cell cycle sensor histidine kinase and response regulator CckA